VRNLIDGPRHISRLQFIIQSGQNLKQINKSTGILQSRISPLREYIMLFLCSQIKFDIPFTIHVSIEGPIIFLNLQIRHLNRENK